MYILNRIFVETNMIHMDTSRVLLVNVLFPDRDEKELLIILSDEEPKNGDTVLMDWCGRLESDDLRIGELLDHDNGVYTVLNQYGNNSVNSHNYPDCTVRKIESISAEGYKNTSFIPAQEVEVYKANLANILRKREIY